MNMTTRRVCRYGLVGLLWVAAGLVPACSKKAPAGALDPNALVGTWTESKSDANPAAARVANTESSALGSSLRQLTLNQDGTFKFVLLAADGKPMKDKGAEGTWKVGQRAISFEVTKNSFDEGIKDLMTPVSGQQTKRDAGETLTIVDNAQNMISYRK